MRARVPTSGAMSDGSADCPEGYCFPLVSPWKILGPQVQCFDAQSVFGNRSRIQIQFMHSPLEESWKSSAVLELQHTLTGQQRREARQIPECRFSSLPTTQLPVECQPERVFAASSNVGGALIVHLAEGLQLLRPGSRPKTVQPWEQRIGV